MMEDRYPGKCSAAQYIGGRGRRLDPHHYVKYAAHDGFNGLHSQ